MSDKLQFVANGNSLECGGQAPLWSVATSRGHVSVESFVRTAASSRRRPKRRQVAALQGVAAFLLAHYGFGVPFAACVVPAAGCASDTLGTSAFVPVAGVTTGVTSLAGAEGAVEFGVSG